MEEFEEMCLALQIERPLVVINHETQIQWQAKISDKPFIFFSGFAADLFKTDFEFPIDLCKHMNSWKHERIQKAKMKSQSAYIPMNKLLESIQALQVFFSPIEDLGQHQNEESEKTLKKWEHTIV